MADFAEEVVFLVDFWFLVTEVDEGAGVLAVEGSWFFGAELTESSVWLGKMPLRALRERRPAGSIRSATWGTGVR